ncbi:MAG: hypothetical protein IJH94_03630 [Clostridia bacterium]|nr:hypothetical protein [Clostridia bacterium]
MCNILFSEVINAKIAYTSLAYGPCSAFGRGKKKTTEPEPMSQAGDMLLFDFGAEPEYGWIQVSEETKYNKYTGYGFSMISFVENAATPAAGGVVSDAVKVNYRYRDRTEFMVDLPEGIYEIAVYTGEIKYMDISLEGHDVLFNINDSCTEARMEIPVTDGTLNMRLLPGISGTELAVSAVNVTRKSGLSERRRRVFICGDSIAATSYPLLLSPPYDEKCPGGWGQMLSSYLPEDVYVHNISSAGFSTSSFLENDTISDRLHFAKEGDIVIIALGINDRKAMTAEEYKENLIELTNRVRACGCVPVLSSDATRLSEYHGNSYIDLCYGAQTKAVARKLDAKYIDLHKAHSDKLCDIGYKNTPSFFLHLWNGSLDLTHPNRAGADLIAELVADRILDLF